MNNMLLVLGLGIAGIDPLGMMFLMTAMALGMSKKQIYSYAAIVFLGTAFLGLGMSGVVSSVLSTLTQTINQLPNIAWVIFNIVISIVFLILGFRRLKAKEEKEEKSEKAGNKGIYAVAFFMVVTALTDPTFLTVLALAGHGNNLFLSFIYNLLWVLISQSPLLLLVLAVVFNKHTIFVEKFNALYEKYKELLAKGLTALFFLLAGVFLLDLLVYLLTNTWLLG